jgi:hypothetical protein
MTGGRRGNCGDAAPSPGRGGGRGWRNQFYATGLTGWQRAAQADAAASPIGDAPDPFARLEGKLTEVLERLDRLDSAGRK